MRRFLRLLVLAALVVGVLADGVATAQQANTLTITCQTVSTSPVKVLAANVYRWWWSIATTSGAPTIYYSNSQANDVAQGAHGHPLLSGEKFTNDVATYTGDVWAVTLTNPAWVCVQEGK